MKGIFEHETSLELVGEDYSALIQYEIDPSDEEESANDICISSVVIRKCVAQRGDVVYHPDGDYHKIYFPEFIELEILYFLNGRQLKALAEEIYAEIKERCWDEVMDEPITMRYNAPTNFPGVNF